MYGARIPTRVKKISNRQRQKLAALAIDHANNVRLILIGVLAQLGGEITVTQGTLAQAGSQLADLDWAIVDGKQPNEVIVRLVNGRERTARQVPTPPDETVEGSHIAYVGADEGNLHATE